MTPQLSLLVAGAVAFVRQTRWLPTPTDPTCAE